MKFRKFIKESLEDMDKRCDECGNLLNEMGTCPYCDDGEEDIVKDDNDDMIESVEPRYHVKQFAENWYVITDSEKSFYKENNTPLFFESLEKAEEKAANLNTKPLTEEMSNIEKLKAAYPELNFDTVVTEDVVNEELSNKEKLLRAYPELNFDNPVIEESVTENMSVRDKLKAAYPELNFSESISEDVTPAPDSEDDEPEFYNVFEDDTMVYDDEYEVDDAEADYAHAALYGGDLTYCKHCGNRLKRNEWGGYCPECDSDEHN